MALKTLTKSSPEFNSNLQYYAVMAKLYLKSKRANMAISLYKKLLNQKPTVSKWWLGLGLSYEANNNAYLAIDAFKKAQEIGSNNIQIDTFIAKKLKSAKHPS